MVCQVKYVQSQSGETMCRIIQSEEFSVALAAKIADLKGKVGCVTGPGRSGAIASAMASHILGVPFIPYGQVCPDHLRPILVIDTATSTGRTLRQAERRYGECVALAVYHEPPRVKFWYESACIIR
jgi:hypothetical protein